MAIKHTILILSYEGETPDSKKKIVLEAQAIEKKLKDKGYEVTLHKQQSDFQEWMNDPVKSKGLNKIHIVAHGNQAQCGNYNGAGLADYIRAYIKGKYDLEAITIHSCMSATPHPTTEKIFIEQFAAKLLTHLKGDFSKYIVVRGSDGESYTDSTGRNWVLKEGVTIPDYRTRDREIGFLKNNTKDRATARPMFAIKNTESYKAVSAL